MKLPLIAGLSEGARVAVAVPVQLLASVTVTLYVPAATLLSVGALVAPAIDQA
ncbi:MAG: hypothetical protein IPL33_19215 [Sphingobacteriales bacterium]|nr:hypothetical protein [Sphingobacteriales bacterium]